MIFVGKENGVVFVGNKLPSDTIGTMLTLTPEEAVNVCDELDALLIEDAASDCEQCFEHMLLDKIDDLGTRIAVLEDMVEYLYED